MQPPAVNITVSVPVYTTLMDRDKMDSYQLLNHNKTWTVWIILGMYFNHTVPNANMLANTSLFVCIGSRGLLQHRIPPPKHSNLNLNIVRYHFSIPHFSVAWSFWNFVQSTAVTLPCSVHNFKMIGNWNWYYGRTRFHKSKMSLEGQPFLQQPPVSQPPFPNSRVYWGLTSKGTHVCLSQAPSPPFHSLQGLNVSQDILSSLQYKTHISMQ